MSKGFSSIAHNHSVVIAGAGIAGLSAALFLNKAGLKVIICERNRELNEFGAGLQLAPNATRILKRLDILDELIPLSTAPQGVRVWRGVDSRLLKCHPLGETSNKLYGSPFLAIHRADLHEVLVRKIAKLADVEIKTDLKFFGFEEDNKEATAYFTDASQKTTSIKAEFVVGSDGVRSRTRRIASWGEEPAYSGKIAWRSVIKAEYAPDFAQEPMINLWLGEKIHLVHYPIKNGREINIVAIVEEEFNSKNFNAIGENDKLIEYFFLWHPKIIDWLAKIPQWHLWPLMDGGKQKGSSKGRLTLIGDAAHPMLPFLAQGANQAIEDAAILGSSINIQNLSIQEKLRNYERLRIKHTSRVQNEARRQGKIYHLGGFSAKMRDLALKITPEKLLTNHFDWMLK